MDSYNKFAAAVKESLLVTNAARADDSDLIWVLFLSLHGFVHFYIHNMKSFEDIAKLADMHVQLLLERFGVIFFCSLIEYQINKYPNEESGFYMGKNIIRALVFIFAFAIAGYAIVQYGVYVPVIWTCIIQTAKARFSPDTMGVRAVRAYCYGYVSPYYWSVSDFSEEIAARRRQHRLMGYVYVISISASGIVGLYLSLFATGGWVAGLGFFGLDVLWVEPLGPPCGKL